MSDMVSIVFYRFYQANTCQYCCLFKVESLLTEEGLLCKTNKEKTCQQLETEISLGYDLSVNTAHWHLCGQCLVGR